MAKKKTKAESSSLYEKLTMVDGYKPELVLIERSSLSLKEQGTKYRLELSSSLPTAAFCIDGQIITSGSRCDKLVLIDTCGESPNWVEVFVELKGSDVLHAVKQLRETIKNPVFHHSSNKKDIFARIVGHSFPGNKSDNSFEKAKSEFRSLFACDLRTLHPGQSDKVL